MDAFDYVTPSIGEMAVQYSNQSETSLGNFVKVNMNDISLFDHFFCATFWVTKEYGCLANATFGPYVFYIFNLYLLSFAKDILNLWFVKFRSPELQDKIIHELQLSYYATAKTVYRGIE